MVPQAAFRAKAPWICYSSLMRSALVRYHEIALKRGNRGHFVEHPKKNLGADHAEVERFHFPEPDQGRGAAWPEPPA